MKIQKEDYDEYIDFLNKINIKREKLVAIVAILTSTILASMHFYAISSILSAIGIVKLTFSAILELNKA